MSLMSSPRLLLLPTMDFSRFSPQTINMEPSSVSNDTRSPIRGCEEVMVATTCTRYQRDYRPGQPCAPCQPASTRQFHFQLFDCLAG
jgi:hypothetical protein